MIQLYDYKFYYFKVSIVHKDKHDQNFFSTGQTFSIRARCLKNAWPAAKRHVKRWAKGRFYSSLEVTLIE